MPEHIIFNAAIKVPEVEILENPCIEILKSTRKYNNKQKANIVRYHNNQAKSRRIKF